MSVLDVSIFLTTLVVSNYLTASLIQDFGGDITPSNKILAVQCTVNTTDLKKKTKQTMKTQRVQVIELTLNWSVINLVVIGQDTHFIEAHNTY